MEAKKVHIVDETGLPMFNRLLDDGTNVMRFAYGAGFILKDQDLTVLRRGQTEIRPGWFVVRPDPCSNYGTCDWKTIDQTTMEASNG